MATPWPPTAEDFAKGQWGPTIWDTNKPTVTAGDPTGKHVAYLQSVINRYNPPTPLLKVDGAPGPKTAAAVAALQTRYGLEATGIVDQATWDLIDWIAFSAYWRPVGRNKYKGWPVDDHGLSRESAFVECYVRANFPTIKLARNWMVDRMQRLSTTVRSEHAYGNALDFTRVTIAQGTAIAEFVKANAARWNVAQVIFNHNIAEPAGGRSKAATAVLWLWRKLRPTALQHVDHVHVTSSSGTLPAIQKGPAL